MAESNKFASNFLSLLDDFKARKPVKENKDNKEGKDNANTKPERKNGDKRPVKKKKDGDEEEEKDKGEVGNGSNAKGAAKKNNPANFAKKINMKTKSSEEILDQRDRLKSEDHVSNEFLSVLNSFDGNHSLNTNQAMSFNLRKSKENEHFTNAQTSCSDTNRDRNLNKRGISCKKPTESKSFKDGRGFNKPENRIMGYKFLESLLYKETSYALTTLANPSSGFQALVNERPIRPDLLMLIINVLGKINRSQAHQLKIQILSNTFSPEFIDELKKFVSFLCVQENQERLSTMNIFFTNLLNVLDAVVNSLPSRVSEKLKSTLNALSLSMNSLKSEHKVEVSEQLFTQLKGLTDQVSSYIEQTSKVKKDVQNLRIKDIPPPDNYRDLPLVPTEDDFKTESYLRQNIIRGSYKDVEHYLDIQFRLLREDFVAPLREGILEYVASLSIPQARKKISNVRVYPKVKFEEPYMSRDVSGFIIQFDCEKRLPKKINWEYNKRFMCNSLLIFTDNLFQSFYLATVVERKIEELQKGLLFIQFVPGTAVPQNLANPGVFYVMAESEVYYEAYKHVLSALQRMNEENFPMKKYIVDVETSCFPPGHLIDNSVYKISNFKVNLLDDSSWPSPEDLKLNLSQHQALKSALTNEFVVIQGPPGTGKTFLALKITEILLKNDVSTNTPIVVICYTNHALDQFLEGILKYTQNLVRIGSQSQNETLQDFTLEKFRKKMPAVNRSHLFRETTWEKFECQNRLKTISDNIEQLGTRQGILLLEMLKSVLNPRHYNEFSGYYNDPLLTWLFAYDDPELQATIHLPTASHQTGDVPEQQNEMTGNLTQATVEAEIMNENFEEEFEEEFEEHDEEESARRFADMHDDEDFYDEDIIKNFNFGNPLQYNTSYSFIQFKIEESENILNKIGGNVQDNQTYYIQQQCMESIMQLKWQRDFMKYQFSRFREFVFNPQRFQLLQNARSVWEMDLNSRWEYYVTLVYLYTCQLKQVVQHCTKEYQDILEKLQELRQLEDIACVQKADVVGLTTSGAAKRRVLLENLGTKIVIVEEAAEVLEAHIVTSLAKSVQHVILIGDHKQLKPNPAVFKLAKKYNMDCSLFERMLNNGMGCSVLKEQHRMRPEIASLISPVIYPDLVNHPSTYDRPKIRGVDKFVFFLSHNQPEDQLPDSSSKQNTYEADLLIELCQYLLLNDYKPNEITILATYTGQVWYMRKRKREMPNMREVRITAVDNFQGEENRIILLSLVRSNKENKIGFLGTENRVCVALSRAKEGLYIVGNMDNLTNSSSIWPRIKRQLEDINGIGTKLLLRCENHPGQITQISHAKDFKDVPEGGCSLKCDAELNCGHKCPRICHVIDKYHGFHKCFEKCERPPCNVEGHKCPLRCWMPCEPCIIRVEKQLLCGHTANLECHKEPAAHNCLVEVPVKHPACNHDITKFCYVKDLENLECKEKCTNRLPDCGHACERNCHVNDDPDHLKYKCVKDCIKEYTGCPRKLHPCKNKCYETCQPCKVLMPTDLPCGHHYKIPCSDDPNTFKCERSCKKTMSCGHKCKEKCWVKCDSTKCTELIDKTAACGHLIQKMKCNEPTSKRICKADCDRKLSCGHPCTDKCCNDCDKVVCKVLVDSPFKPPCGHAGFKIQCHEARSMVEDDRDKLLPRCEHPCDKAMGCGHQCKGTCGECLQGRLHVPCTLPCKKTLFCGHMCRSKCGVLCPPCPVTKCPIRCAHRRCGNKHPCFKLCTDKCEKPCRWKCKHHECKKKCWEECNRPPCYEPCPLMLTCNHPCMGYCGDVCPKVCVVCDPDKPVTSSPGDRFVLLNDCSHIVSSKKMDSLVARAERSNIIVHKLVICPNEDCSEPVVNTQRYRNVYLKFRNQIEKIEETICNYEKITLRRKSAFYAELWSSQPTVCSKMNSFMDICRQSLRNGISAKDRVTPILVSLLHPLVELRTTKVPSKEKLQVKRLELRLEYLAEVLFKRMADSTLSYEAILQLELVVANIVRLTVPSLTGAKAPYSLWFETEPWTWEKDRDYGHIIESIERMLRISTTLRIRDGFKQWFECGYQHWYISENREVCATCVDEEEERQRMKEEEERKRMKEEEERQRKRQRVQENQTKRNNPAVTDWTTTQRWVGQGRGQGRGGGRGQGRGGGRGQGRGGGRGQGRGGGRGQGRGRGG